MPLPYPGKNIPTARPTLRKIDMRSLSYGLSGAEQPYPVYQFAGGRARLEYPRHNPFKDSGPFIATEGNQVIQTEGGVDIQVG